MRRHSAQGMPAAGAAPAQSGTALPRRRAIRAGAALWLLLAAGCGGLSDEKAVEVVKAYDQKLVQAYRAGDARLVEGVASPAEAKKITGLIGAKLDMGITLDADLLELRPVKVERRGEEVLVLAEERWHYLDRRVGTGQPVGQESTDRYSVRYHLGRSEGRWVVNAVEFAEPPQVGRTEFLGKGAVPGMHGIDTLGPEAHGGAPASRAGAPDGGATR